jgi:hypothetical protein
MNQHIQHLCDTGWAIKNSWRDGHYRRNTMGYTKKGCILTTVQIPEKLHAVLKKTSAKHHRSITAQVVVYIEQGIEKDG